MPQDKKNQHPHAQRAERNAVKAQKMILRAAREQLQEKAEKAQKMILTAAKEQLQKKELRTRIAIVKEANKATRTDITPAYHELKNENENAFVMADAPVAPQVASNRFSLFGSAVSSIGNLATTCASYLNPFRK